MILRNKRLKRVIDCKLNDMLSEDSIMHNILRNNNSLKEALELKVINFIASRLDTTLSTPDGIIVS